MTRNEIYDNINRTCDSYKYCFCWSTSRKWVTMFFEKHYEVWSTHQWIELNGEKVYLDELKTKDETLHNMYYNRWMKVGKQIGMEWVEACKVEHEKKEKEKATKKEKKVKRK